MKTTHSPGTCPQASQGEGGSPTGSEHNQVWPSAKNPQTLQHRLHTPQRGGTERRGHQKAGQSGVKRPPLAPAASGYVRRSRFSPGRNSPSDRRNVDPVPKAPAKHTTKVYFSLSFFQAFTSDHPKNPHCGGSGPRSQISQRETNRQHPPAPPEGGPRCAHQSCPWLLPWSPHMW